MPGFSRRLFRLGAIPEEELPECLRREVRRALPDVEYGDVRKRPSRRRRWREEYEATALSAGRTVQIEVEVDIENDSVYELEINFIEGADHRRIENAEPLPVAEIPPHVRERARSAVATMVNDFVPEYCERGTHRGGAAYRIKGEAGGWEVKIKLVEDGPVLEMQKKRVSRGT